MVGRLELLLVIDERWLKLGYVVGWGPVLVFVGLLMSLVLILHLFLLGGIMTLIRELTTSCVICRLSHLVLLQNLDDGISSGVRYSEVMTVYDKWENR